MLAACGLTVAAERGGAAEAGIGVPWRELRAVELRLRELRHASAVVQEAILAWGEHGDWSGNRTVEDARSRVREAEAVYAKLCAEPDPAEIVRLRDEAENTSRVTIEARVIGDEPAYAALIASIESARKDRDALEARGKLSLDEARKLAGLRKETARLEWIRAAQITALWTHDDGKEVAAACAERRAKWNEAHGKDTPAGEARAVLDEARKALREASEPVVLPVAE